jgi:hypothetical protein
VVAALTLAASVALAEQPITFQGIGPLRILRVELNPAQRAHVMGVSVRLRELLVSVSDVSVLAAARTAASTRVTAAAS